MLANRNSIPGTYKARHAICIIWNRNSSFLNGFQGLVLLVLVVVGGGSTGFGKYGTTGFPGREGVGNEKAGGFGWTNGGSFGSLWIFGSLWTFGSSWTLGNGRKRRRRDENASLLSENATTMRKKITNNL